MIYAGTGHRPSKLLGFGKESELRLKDFASVVLQKIKPTKIISGLAIGWDTALAQAAIELNIPFDAYLPFEDQAGRWPKDSQKEWQRLKSMAVSVKCCSKTFNNVCMQQRNEWMVDNSDVVLALWDGSNGGTKNCVDYAKRKNKKIVNCWKDFERIFFDKRNNA